MTKPRRLTPVQDGDTPETISERQPAATIRVTRSGRIALGVTWATALVVVSCGPVKSVINGGDILNDLESEMARDAGRIALTTDIPVTTATRPLDIGLTGNPDQNQRALLEAFPWPKVSRNPAETEKAAAVLCGLVAINGEDVPEQARDAYEQGSEETHDTASAGHHYIAAEWCYGELLNDVIRMEEFLVPKPNQ